MDPSKAKTVDVSTIVSDNLIPKVPLHGSGDSRRPIGEERPNSEDFVDDPDVPPLM